jgi:tetratricopeptide (TPR) repeat protein
MAKIENNKAISNNQKLENSKFNFYYLIILFLTLIIPPFVLLNGIDNVFERPKTLLLVSGAALLIGLYVIRFLRGKPVPVSGSDTSKIVIFLLLLNGFNLFYTKNYYYTCFAAAMHVSSLIVFYITAINIDSKKAFWLLIAVALSGLFVATDSWLQFFDIFLLFKGHPGMMIVGTIGNPDHLGAYLLFPLFALTGLFFLTKGKYRWLAGLIFLFIFSAFLVVRARASWIAFAIAFPIFLGIIKKIHCFSIRTYLKAHAVSSLSVILIMLLLFSVAWYKMPPRFQNTLSPSSIFESTTLQQRFYKYWPSAIWLFEQNPLFGNGFWSYRNMVYTAQAEIYKKDKDFFKNYDAPKPREAHNDLIEVFNEGGIVLGFALLFFLVIVLRHGWMIIKNDQIENKARIITATAFSATIAIMIASIFFFPFRVNTTIFMAALMMGLVESLYLSNLNLIQFKSAKKTGGNALLIALISLSLIGFVWVTAIKPLLGEREFFKYHVSLNKGDYRSAENHVLKALKYDPLNTAYNIDTSELYLVVFKDPQKANDYLEKAINHFNGDIVEWAFYDIKGHLKLQLGSLLEAKAAFERALYLYPEDEKAQQGLAVVNKILAEKVNRPPEKPKAQN